MLTLEEKQTIIIYRKQKAYDNLNEAREVAKGLLEKEYGRLFSRLFKLRQSGDYDDLYSATEEEVCPYIQKISYFKSRMEELISTFEIPVK